MRCGNFKPSRLYRHRTIIMPLSETAQKLIPKARIVSFEAWQATHPASAIAIFQAADDQRLYLTDAELEQLRQAAPAQAANFPVVQALRDQVTDIVDEARAGVLAQFPNILEPGGGLYPPERAEACWRDFWHFLRCMTYGIAGGHIAYTSQTGLEAMRQLYQELQVPLDAMVYGLQGLKAASLRRILSPHDQDLAPYFDHLITCLDQFRAG
jgi:hypothetical protein